MEISSLSEVSEFELDLISVRVTFDLMVAKVRVKLGKQKDQRFKLDKRVAKVTTFRQQGRCYRCIAHGQYSDEDC